ncbi:MAG: DUF5658 family protein [Actinobacteria bacterium]|nr:DUF5658 family protein [Actinomycetota bacterium]
MDGSLWLLLFLNLADITLTKYLVDLGAFELNPIIRHLLAVDFLWALLFKILIVGLFVFLTRGAIRESSLVRRTVNIANAFFVMLVIYQLIGVVYLS